MSLNILEIEHWQQTYNTAILPWPGWLRTFINMLLPRWIGIIASNLLTVQTLLLRCSNRHLHWKTAVLMPHELSLSTWGQKNKLPVRHIDRFRNRSLFGLWVLYFFSIFIHILSYIIYLMYTNCITSFKRTSCGVLFFFFLETPVSDLSVHPILLPIETLSLLILCQLTSSFTAMIFTTPRGCNLT